MKEVKIYKFGYGSLESFESIKESKPYIIADKLNKGQKLTDSEKEYLTRAVNENVFFKDSIPYKGFRFNFSEFLKTFLVLRYGTWVEYKAYNKSTLRAYIYGRIDKIVEI